MTRVFCIIFFFTCISASGQAPWTFNTKLRIIASSSSFLCDLGGKDAVGTNDISDLNLEQTRYALGMGLQHYYENWSVGANAFYIRLAADDRLTKAGRAVRQLHVITDVAELSINAEYTVPKNVPLLKNFYFNLGLGIMLYQPQARYQGTLYKLRPLGTEGQYYIVGKTPYRIYSPVIPFGVGYKFQLPNLATLSLDLSLRKSFTDYLDDVSTVYADAEIIGSLSGEAAQYFADPSVRGQKIGTQRGDPKDNDQYFLIGFRFEFPLHISNTYKMNTRCSFQKQTYNFQKQPTYSRRRLRRNR